MKWQIDEIMKMETHRLNPFSEELISRADVIELLDRKCKDCKHFERKQELSQYSKKKRWWTYCNNPKSRMFADGKKMTSGCHTGCARFERSKHE